VILAAGKGTRMKSALPKVLHEVCGRPLLVWVLEAAASIPPRAPDPVVVVVPPDPDEAERVTALLPAGAQAVVQRELRGTGDAVRQAQRALEGYSGPVLVLYGDTPLLEPALMAELVDAHRDARSAATILTVERRGEVYADFGRVIRDDDGELLRIVEARDATPAERGLTEVNSGIALFDAEALWPTLERLTANNDQGELYLTDVAGILAAEGRRVLAHRGGESLSVYGINTRADLAEADRLLRARIARAHMLAGVTIVDPATTFIDPTVTLEPDAVIHPFTILRGGTHVAAGASVGPHVVVVDARIGPGVSVGPFCYLRPETDLREGAKAGTFVEIKASLIGAGAKVPHLSYVGDAEIGEETNVGAGNITANYDGERKQRTTIGRDVHTGSDNVFVAPVTVGDGAWTAAGSIITEDVPPEALGIARSRQVNIEGYGRRKRR
jgi:bifunctional UDP-N-acetylglucosamine pyrophosphorylase / glucosamine-1-phosphate N-acetyltransferase